MNSQFRNRRDKRKAGDFSKITNIFDEDELNKLDIKISNENDLDEDIEIEVNNEEFIPDKGSSKFINNKIFILIFSI